MLYRSPVMTYVIFTGMLRSITPQQESVKQSGLKLKKVTLTQSNLTHLDYGD